MPQTIVSQSGMLSRLPGAKNFPRSPMMTPSCAEQGIAKASSSVLGTRADWLSSKRD